MSDGPAKAFLQKALKFLGEDLWAPLSAAGQSGDSTAPVSPLHALLMRSLRVLVLALEGLRRDLCLLRASALTYVSLMALVPVLALAFAVLRGLGWRGDRLESLILGQFTVLSNDAIRTIVSYIDNTNIAGLGALGAAALMFTFISLMRNIESSLNAIWGDPPPRTVLRQVGDYLAVIVAAPLMLAVATSLTATVRSNSMFLWVNDLWGVGEGLLRLSAAAVVWLLFAFLYVFVPNTKVRAVPALIGAVVAGSMWLGMQSAYVGFQMGMSKYNAIYGAMAQLPILMLWVYVSWVVVLMGAEIAAAVQNLSVYSEERRSTARGAWVREHLGLAICAELAASAHARTPPPTLEMLASSLGFPVRMVRATANALIEGGVMHFGGGEAELCFLSLAPRSIPVSRVLDLLDGRDADGDGDLHDAVLPEELGGVNSLLERVETARRGALGEATLADLLG